jgi:hypothetical protein
VWRRPNRRKPARAKLLEPLPTEGPVRACQGGLADSDSDRGERQNRRVIAQTAAAPDIGSSVGFIVGAAGLAVAIVREMIAARERRRARPVVVAHEVRRRHFRDGMGGGQAATVRLTNESSASAFNVRFGLEMKNVVVPWKHDLSDMDASRVNVIGPGATYPSQGELEIVIPDQVIWGLRGGDPDPGRAYWAYYQDARGDWWRTRNPWRRSADLTVKRVRSRRFNAWSRRNRRLDQAFRLGGARVHQAIAELRDPPPDANREEPRDPDGP